MYDAKATSIITPLTIKKAAIYWYKSISYIITTCSNPNSTATGAAISRLLYWWKTFFSM